MDWKQHRLTRRLRLSSALTRELYGLLTRIDAVKHSWKITQNLQPRTIDRLTQSVIITSTGASNRIEGNRLSDEEIEAIYRDMRIQRLKTRDEQEVVGYLEQLQFAFENFEDIGITESNILMLHDHLLRHSEKDARHRGGYKFGSNRVEAKDQSGNVLGVVFDPTPPHLVPKEMSELVDWYAWARVEDESHPLIHTANFLFEYLAIHPFQDGNGRTSRLLTNLMLLQHGYAFTQIVSHERLIEQVKADYYLALNQAQKTWKKKPEDLAPWFRFFLQIVHGQADEALAILERGDGDSLLSENQQALLNWAGTLGGEAFARRDAIEALNLPARTVEATIKKLVELKRLTRLGQGRATRYVVR